MSVLNRFSIEGKYTEKRDFVRMQINVPILLTITATSQTFTGMCKNLSGNGLLFNTTNKIDLGTKLSLSIHSPNNEFNHLHAIIQVVRIDHDPATNSVFAVGAKILQRQ